MLLNGKTAMEGPSGQRERRSLDRHSVHVNPIGTHGLCDVLERLYSEVAERVRQFLVNLVICSSRDAYPAGLCDAFEACSDVDAITVNAGIAMDDVQRLCRCEIACAVSARRPRSAPSSSVESQRPRRRSPHCRTPVPSPAVSMMRPPWSTIMGSKIL